MVFVSKTRENLQKPKENVAKRRKTYKNLRKTNIFRRSYGPSTITREENKIARGWTSSKQLKLQDRQRQEHQENQGNTRKSTKTKEKLRSPGTLGPLTTTLSSRPHCTTVLFNRALFFRPEDTTKINYLATRV